MTDRHNARPRLSQREIRACAYHIVDIVETRALALRQADPTLTVAQSIDRALAQLAGF